MTTDLFVGEQQKKSLFNVTEFLRKDKFRLIEVEQVRDGTVRNGQWSCGHAVEDTGYGCMSVILVYVPSLRILRKKISETIL